MAYRDEYLQSALWRRIRKRVLKRDDGNLCLRCGGKANRVHHRSYDAYVMLGNDDTKLASVCDGCHTFIHFTAGGGKRSAEETDQLLLLRDESADFPAPTIDLRKKGMDDLPAEWERMSARRRTAWYREHSRLYYLRLLQKGASPSWTERLRSWLHGLEMDDAQIDLALSKKGRKRTTIAYVRRYHEETFMPGGTFVVGGLEHIVVRRIRAEYREVRS